MGEDRQMPMIQCFGLAEKRRKAPRPFKAPKFSVFNARRIPFNNPNNPLPLVRLFPARWQLSHANVSGYRKIESGKYPQWMTPFRRPGKMRIQRSHHIQIARLSTSSNTAPNVLPLIFFRLICITPFSPWINPTQNCSRICTFKCLGMIKVSLYCMVHDSFGNNLTATSVLGRFFPRSTDTHYLQWLNGKQAVVSNGCRAAKKV